MNSAFSIRALICAAPLVGACAQITEGVDNVARDGAKAAVNEALVTQVPGVPKAMVTPFTDCVIDNASAREIGSLAQDALVGVDQGTANLVLEIAGRPEASQCIAKAGLSQALTL